MADIEENKPNMNNISSVDAPAPESKGEFEIHRMDTDILVVDKETPSPEELENNVSATILPELEEDEEEEFDENIELSPGGVLDEETIGRGLSNLGRSADGMHQVYLHLTVPGFNLIDISILQDYVHLQKVEFPHNELTDLSVLSNLPHLLILDVSHNKLTTILDFTPPKNLQIVDLSYNEIEVMTDLSAHHSLKKLNLSYNKISEINGLSGCKRLEDLNLAHNQIKCMKNLDGLPIQVLNLGHNELNMIKNLESLHRLKSLDLSGNKVRSLAGVEGHDLLECLDLEDNEVIDLAEIKYLQDLRMFRSINLHRNPIQELPEYRLCILFRLQSLTELDKHKADAEEKVAARNMFDPPAEVVAARDHIMHVVYSFLQPAQIHDSTLPSSETPYPMLVLVGPQGSGKKDLGLKLVDEFSQFFGFSVSHTTRSPYTGEEDGFDYHFVSLEKFENDIKMGKFIQTSQHHGSWYGLQMDSIQSVAKNGQACVVHMDFEGVLTLKNTHFEPRYVLIMPLDKESHERRLRDRGIYNDEEILETVKTAETYSSYNQDHPGFFDMMVNSDDIQEAYIELRRMVMDYLGMGPPSPTTENPLESPSKVEAVDHFPPSNTTTNILTRTWSRPSMSESMSIRAPSGIVEEESFRLRLSAAKGVVSGYIPPLYEKILESCPRTAPQSVGNQIGLGDDQRALSAPAKNTARRGPIVMDSPDSSASHVSTSDLSDLDSATELQRGNLYQSPKSKTVVHPLEFPDDLMKSNNSSVLLAPRPPSTTRPDSQNSKRYRPGSEKHMVLPPIQPVH